MKVLLELENESVLKYVLFGLYDAGIKAKQHVAHDDFGYIELPAADAERALELAKVVSNTVDRAESDAEQTLQKQRARISHLVKENWELCDKMEESR